MPKFRFLRFAIPMLAVCVLGLSACNTAEGIGKDTEAAGEAIQRKAN
ncbi:MAG: entericidin A/B family lipoprotein [Acetobacterales bacterium]